MLNQTFEVHTLSHEDLVIKRCPMDTFSITTIARIHPGQTEINNCGLNSIRPVIHIYAPRFGFQLLVSIQRLERVRLRWQILHQDLAPVEITVLQKNKL
jgi:hypothetical protein